MGREERAEGVEARVGARGPPYLPSSSYCSAERQKEGEGLVSRAPPRQAWMATTTGVLRPQTGHWAPGEEEALAMAVAFGEGSGPRAPLSYWGSEQGAARPGGPQLGLPGARLGGARGVQVPLHPGTRDLQGRGGLGCGVKSEEPTAEGVTLEPSDQGQSGVR